MESVRGKSVLNAVAAGPLRVWRRRASAVNTASRLTPVQERERLDAALREAGQRLDALREKALAQAGGESAAIFEIHQMMLEDEDFLDAVRDAIDTGAAAESAALEAGEQFAGMFEAMDDPYMRARADDVRDIARQLAEILTGGKAEDPLAAGKAILAADDLSPSETAGLDRDKLLGLVTRRGSPDSHTAILARTMRIPALVGADFDDAWDGKPAVLDGRAGALYVDPTPEILAAAEARLLEAEEQASLLQALRGLPSVTQDGREVQVYANIGGVADVQAALQNDAGGIGLFRSEFLYLGREDWPGEEEQFAAYRQVAQLMGGREVVIRTLDAGADKQAAYMGLPSERNPALGLRGLRLCLALPEMFKVQLRSILRAAAFGRVSVLLPMVTDAGQVRAVKELLATCREELNAERLPAGPTEVGVMIETPAAALTAGELAVEADFFSLGTNDLIQYTLAVDRQDESLEPYRNPYHPAVPRLIQMTVDAARLRGRRVGMCGGLAADLSLTDALLRMGLDELSVPPGEVLALRKHIRELDLR